MLAVEGDGDAIDSVPLPEPLPLPRLDKAALFGLAGDIVRVVDPETEADPAGVLLSLLTGFGSAVGISPRIHAGGWHHANLFASIVGRTSDAKGSAVSLGLLPVQQADPEWWGNSIGCG